MAIKTERLNASCKGSRRQSTDTERVGRVKLGEKTLKKTPVIFR